MKKIITTALSIFFFVSVNTIASPSQLDKFNKSRSLEKPSSDESSEHEPRKRSIAPYLVVGGATLLLATQVGGDDGGASDQDERRNVLVGGALLIGAIATYRHFSDDGTEHNFAMGLNGNTPMFSYSRSF